MFKKIRQDNRGVSLIAVIIAITFVTLIGIIITRTTITNIRMKEVETATKQNFYSSEQIMDELKAGLNDKAATAMKDAYVNTLSTYRTVMVYGSNIQDTFSKMYLTNLKNAFFCPADAAGGNSEFEYGVISCDMALDTGFPKIIKDSLDDSSKFIAPTSKTVQYEVDYKNQVFVIKNLKIKNTETNGYETVITTDMVFHTPVLNFNGSNSVKDFMKFCLIADTKLAVEGSSANVTGSVYAGADGLVAGTGSKNSVFSGPMIVVRGDIVANNNTIITVGGATSKIYAENVETVGTGTASKLTLQGNMYISDDLTLSGDNSEVYLIGNYYGYNFQEKYDEETYNKDAYFSSAIVVNGKKAKLDMSGLSHLLLSGRTYIARSKGTTLGGIDVPMGESLSVRSNQMAYFVPSQYVNTGSNTILPDKLVDLAAFMNVPTTAISNNCKSTTVAGTAHISVAAYNYVTRVTGAGGSIDTLNDTAYYLDFKDEQSANNFFKIYYDANNSTASSNKNEKIDLMAERYLSDDAVILNPDSSSMLITLKGDLLYRADSGEKLKEKAYTIGGSWDKDKIYWTFAKKTARTYKALQLYLDNNSALIDADNLRFYKQVPYGAGTIDVFDEKKTSDRLFDNLINEASLQAALGAEDIKTEGSGDETIIFTSKSSYTIPSTVTGGIVVSSGNIQVSSNFKGMIIAKGTITVNSGVTIDSDELKISKMFSEDMALKDAAVFTKFFKGFGSYTDSFIGEVKVDDYLFYDNWTKTEE